MRDLIAEISGTSPISRPTGTRDLIAEMGGVMPSEQPYEPTFWDRILKGGGAELETLSDPSNPEAAAVVAATGGSLAVMPVAGIAGLSKTITSGLDEGQKTLEGVSGIPGKLIKTEEQARAAGEIGKLMEPFAMAGRGLGGVTELVSTGDAYKATDVIKGRSEGSNVAVPIANVMGQVFAMFGLPGTPKAAKSWWNGLPYRKRLMVVDQVKADIASGEFTGAQIRELWKNGTPEERAAFVDRYARGVGSAERTGPVMRASGADVQGELPPGQGFQTYPSPERAAFSPELAADIQTAGRPALPPGQGFELRPRPGEVRDILAEMGNEGPKALPPGQGFELRPTAEEIRDLFATETKALPYPEGIGEGFRSRPGEVELPIVTKAGEPFKTEKSATIAGKGLDWNLYEVTPAEDGGFQITRKQGQEIRTPNAPKIDELDRLRAQVKAEDEARANGTFVQPETPPIPRPSAPEIVEPGANVEAVSPLPKPNAAKGPQNLITYLESQGGVNWGTDAPLTRQHPDGKRTARSTGQSPDAAAQMANGEGWRQPSGELWDPDSLHEAVISGKGRNIFAPEKSDAIIARKLRRETNAWADEQAELEAGKIDTGRIEASREDLAAEIIAAAKEQGEILRPDEALTEVDAFIAEGKKPTKEDFIGKTETGNVAGVPNDFNLVNPETEINRGVLSKKDMTPTGDVFAETPERFIKERLESDVYYWKTGKGSKLSAAPERLKEVTKTLNDYNQGKLTKAEKGYVERIRGEHHEKLIGSERGSIPVNESEILQAILKTRGKIEEAMPHLEALGRSVYEGGKQRFLDWNAKMKTALGDLWESFKAHLKGIFERLQKGEIGPLGNQKGAVGLDINKGPIIKQREIKDAKTGEIRQAPAVYEKEFEAVKKMPELRQKPLGGWLENPIRTFEELGADIKELFYRPIKEGEHLAKKHFQKIHEKSEAIRKSLPGKSSERIEIYAISQQKDGAEILGKMGITEIPKLTPEEMKAYQWMRTGLETFFEKLQEARAKAGKEGFGHVEDYFTFARQFTLMEKLGFSPIFSRLELLQNVFHRKTTPFAYEKHRVGGLTRADLDAFGIFNRYMESATRHYYLSPAIAKGREMLLTFHEGEGKWILRDEKPGAAKFITEWLDYQAGQRKPQLPNLIEKSLTKLNKNLAFSILSANLRSALIQPSSLVNTVTEIGPKWTYEGIKSILDNSAIEKSNVLLSRQFDVNVTESLAGMPGKLGKAKQVVGNVGMKPLQFLDMQSAKVTWNGAYRKGLSEKMSEGEARNYADDTVTKTQGSAMPSDLAPIQRTALGKSLSMFQTFVINQWGFITRDVMGIKNPAIKTPQMVKKVASFILAATASNILYEDILGVPSPLPSPISAFVKALDRGEEWPSASAEAAREIATFVPIVGGGVRYGSSILGAPVEFIGDIGKKLAPNYVGPTRSTAELVAKRLGVPGTAQLVKSLRIANKGGSPVDIVLGRYPDQEGKLVKLKTLKGLKGGLK